MVNELAALMVNAGMIAAISGSWSEEVRENYRAKLRTIRAMATDQIVEIQAFAEAYD